jgi:tungstate transport system substrate-binding protein
MKNPIRSLRSRFLLLAGATALLFAGPISAATPFITLASTTSTQNSGLFDYLLPKFKAATGIDVHVVAVGTGAALDMGKRCDADALLVHAKPAELKYVKAGYGIDRRDVMYNDFVIVGPASDPAGVKGMKNAAKALEKIAKARSVFLSRGDNSGTNKKELALWRKTDVKPQKASGGWYRETGSGMGATLNTAAAMNGYTLTDRGTWISFNNRRNLKILVQGDPDLFNQYGVMLVNPKRCPNVKKGLAMKFHNWIISPAGQKVVADYRLKGKQLFHPDAK